MTNMKQDWANKKAAEAYSQWIKGGNFLEIVPKLLRAERAVCKRECDKRVRELLKDLGVKN